MIQPTFLPLCAVPLFCGYFIVLGCEYLVLMLPSVAETYSCHWYRDFPWVFPFLHPPSFLLLHIYTTPHTQNEYYRRLNSWLNTYMYISLFGVTLQRITLESVLEPFFLRENHLSTFSSEKAKLTHWAADVHMYHEYCVQ